MGTKITSTRTQSYRYFHLCRENIDFVGQETNPAAPSEVIFFPKVEQYLQAMRRLTNLPAPIMVILWPLLAPIWVVYDFGDTSAEGCSGKFQPVTQLLRIRIGFWCTGSSEKAYNKREF